MRDADHGSSSNGKTLVIVESGAKADTIARFLDDDYVVTACFGHVRDLPRRAAERPAKIKGQPWADLAVDVDHGFEPYYIVPSESKKHVARLRKELKQADRVLLATDEDREGESIGWHLVEVLKPKVPYERIVFHEITPAAIERALESPRGIDEHLVEAQESRRILDRLYGYSLSPVLWRKLGQGTSAGRVQSVALKFLVDRERERMAFVTAEYWGADGEFEIDGQRLAARLQSLGGADLASGSSDFDPATGRLSAEGKRWETEASLTELKPHLEAATWRVANVGKTQAKMRPAAPFTTSTMQQAASNRLGMGAARAMAAAQRLYQGVDLGAERVGLITYMRTDSVTLSDQALAQASDYINTTYGEDFHQFRTYRTRSRNAQEAHEAIRPTDIARTPESLRGRLDEDDFRLYDLIWRRAVASQMADAQVERTRIEIEAALPGRRGDDPALMVANGQVVVFPGWYEVLPPRGDGQQLLPDVAAGASLPLVELTLRGSESQPPPRFTEASLVKKLEDDGLGRPSTYAAIIKTLTDRNYASRSGRTLIPTFLGFGVCDLLTEHFADLVNAEFTADMEDRLDRIARGEARAASHLHDFYFGDADAENGLKGRVAEKIDTIPFWALNLTDDGLALDLDGDEHVGPEDVQVRIRGGSSFLRRGVGDDMRTAPLPPDLAPADFTLAQADELLETTLQLPRRLGRHPTYDDEVWLLNGRFGPFVQVGNAVGRPKKGQPKPRRASVPKDMELADVNIEHAIDWLQWPKTLGKHPELGEEVTVRPGRWGAYVSCGDERRNLKDGDDLDTIKLERALELLAEPKAARRGRGAGRGSGRGSRRGSRRRSGPSS